MIWLPLIAFLSVLSLVVGFLANYTAADPLFPLSARRYRRCLANIARLERELGIGPQPIRQGEEFFELKPGARWLVDDPSDIRFIDPTTPAASQRWGIEHGMLYHDELEAAYKVLEDA